MVLGSVSERGTQILDLNYADRKFVIKGLIMFAFTGIVANGCKRPCTNVARRGAIIISREVEVEVEVLSL